MAAIGLVVLLGTLVLVSFRWRRRSRGKAAAELAAESTPLLRLVTPDTEDMSRGQTPGHVPEPAANGRPRAAQERDEQLVAVLNERPPRLGPTVIQAARRAAELAIVNAPPVGHLLFVPTEAGYTLESVQGEAPDVGTRMNGLNPGVESRFIVSKVGPSPLPGDPRRCAYLEQLAMSRTEPGE